MADEIGLRAGGEDAVDQTVAQRDEAHVVRRAISSRASSAARAQPDDAGDIFGRRAQAALLAAAVDDRRKLNALAHKKRADALGAVELVRRERQQIDRRGAHIEGELPAACTASVWNSAPARARWRRFR